MTTRITIVSASIGAGHDGAAAELARRLAGAGFAVDRHDFLDLLPASLGRTLRWAYALQLRAVPDSWGRLCTALERRSGLHSTATRVGFLAGRRLAAAMPAGTAAVVSTYPLAGQALGRLRLAGRLDVPAITYLTDMSVHPLWVADGVDAYLALHEVPAGQARRLGAAAVHVTGPAVPSAFRPAGSALARRAARVRFGLPVAERLALVVAGSWGVGDVERTARDIAASGLARPVVVCGHNAALRSAVARAGTGVALGWVDDMPELLRACDVVVQNAGGLSSLEALATGLPVLSYRCLPGHGTTNALAQDEAGWARRVHGPEHLRAALAGPHPVVPPPYGDPAEVIAALARRPLAVAR